MACSVVDVLDRYGVVDRDALASAFAERAEQCRAYGKGALRLLAKVRGGADWREISANLFDGTGSWGNGGAMRVTPLGAYFADDFSTAASQGAASAEGAHAQPGGVGGGGGGAGGAAQAATLRGNVVRLPATELIERPLEHVPPSDVRTGLQKALGLLDCSVDEAVAEL